MDLSFFNYLHRLEMMAFFSGYPLFFAIVVFLFGKRKPGKSISHKIVTFLPYAYALVGTLYLAMQLKNLYPDYSIEKIGLSVQEAPLKIWALLSLLFWIPGINKKPVLSLLHSFVFFFFMAKDILLVVFLPSGDQFIIRNSMKVYSDSLLLNLGSLAAISIFYFLLFRLKIIKEAT